MGFFDDIAFGASSKPRVTGKEYIKAKGELRNKGFNSIQIANVDKFFAPEFNIAATPSHPKGLEKKEIDARIKWMREHKSKHSFDDKQIDEIEESLTKRT
jgi:hypothetical protein